MKKPVKSCNCWLCWLLQLSSLTNPNISSFPAPGKHNINAKVLISPPLPRTPAPQKSVVRFHKKTSWPIGILTKWLKKHPYHNWIGYHALFINSIAKGFADCSNESIIQARPSFREFIHHHHPLITWLIIHPKGHPVIPAEVKQCLDGAFLGSNVKPQWFRTVETWMSNRLSHPLTASIQKLHHP